MVAFWMSGYEDEPERSSEICICEIFGRDVTPARAAVGMGVHPFGDPAIVDEFAAEAVAMDVREFHVYQAEWTPQYVAFIIDHRLVRTVAQSPHYPMQFMLGIYEFPDAEGSSGPTHPIQNSSRSTTSAVTGPSHVEEVQIHGGSTSPAGLSPANRHCHRNTPFGRARVYLRVR
jgi:Glycosyl hydrolases family 16